MNKDKQPQENNNQTNTSSNRMFIFGLTLLLIIALPIMSYKLAHDWRKLKTVQAELSSVKRQASDLAILQQRINKYKAYHNELKQLMENADQSQLGDTYWIERQVAINKRQINRSEASGFLTGSGRSSDAFFKTAMFDIHTVQLGDDLFKFRQGDANDVQMTMDGTFYTKIKQ
jgi:hypothetical protein